MKTLLQSSWKPLRRHFSVVLTGVAVLLLGAVPLAWGHRAPDGTSSGEDAVARPAEADATTRPTSVPEALDGIERRLDRLDRGLLGLERAWDDRVRPVERVLAPFHEDEDWVRRISLSLVREGYATGIDPRVLASVLLVENPWLDPDVESSVGAVGLMQVMPLHAGRWGCGSDDLTDVETNICHGARIFAALLADRGDVDRALLAYNGCVRGTNTPDCHLYPSHVYSRVGRAAMQRWLDRE